MNITFSAFRTILLLFVAFATSANISVQAQSKLEKDLAKQRTRVYKNLVKEYKNEGWKLANNNTTMEVAILEHLTTLDSPANDYETVTGEVTKCRSMNVGRMSAINNAQNQLAQRMQGEIEGFVSSLINADAENIDAEQDKMVAAFNNKIKISLTGALKPSYAIYKENPDGTYRYKAFFFVDKSKCIAAANSAVEKSLKEASVALDLADKIKDFVNNGMTITD